jgi:hypothetical protein
MQLCNLLLQPCNISFCESNLLKLCLCLKQIN